MRNIREKRYRRRMELSQLYNSTRHRALKYSAMSAFAVVVILLITMIILMNSLSLWMLHLLRGLAGLSAIIGVAIYGIYAYRINLDYQRGARECKEESTPASGHKA